jgi:hypothetical protein
LTTPPGRDLELIRYHMQRRTSVPSRASRGRREDLGLKADYPLSEKALLMASFDTGVLYDG